MTTLPLAQLRADFPMVSLHSAWRDACGKGLWEAGKLGKKLTFSLPRGRRSPLTFAIPVVVTTALSGVLIKILNR